MHTDGREESENGVTLLLHVLREMLTHTLTNRSNQKLKGGLVWFASLPQFSLFFLPRLT